MELALLLGLACWVATTIVVESEIVKPLRSFVGRKTNACKLRNRAAVIARDTKGARRSKRQHAVLFKLDYLLTCHLCAGTWIGLVIAGVVGGPVQLGNTFVAVVANGLVIKGVAHFVLGVTNTLERVAR